MFLLPSNAAVDVLSRTALRRQEVFEWLQNSGARTVTVFLDTCFSGGTRGEETLVADARGFGLSARDESVPESFTLISAATGAQTSTSLPEAQQGLFSYFLMKGMEGDADANGDNKITATAITKSQPANFMPSWPQALPVRRTGWAPTKPPKLLAIPTAYSWPGKSPSPPLN